MIDRHHAPDGKIRFLYRFEFATAPAKEFEVLLDEKTLELELPERSTKIPEWIRLEVNKCPHCPLEEKPGAVCPAAQSLEPVVEFFAELNGHDEAIVTVVARERTYVKRCSLQIGISSLMGLLLPGSGCPVVAPLRPLLRSHLPFSTSYETIPRMAGWYLLEQYMSGRAGNEADWELSQLESLYRELERMNRSLNGRLGTRKIEDASLNAVVHLSIFAELLTLSVSQDSLREILESLFD